MNMTPMKKIVLALAAVTIVVSMVTANNVASMMMIMAAKKNTQVVVNAGPAAPVAPVAPVAPAPAPTPAPAPAPAPAPTTPSTPSTDTEDTTAAPEANADAEKPADSTGKPESKEQVIKYYETAIANAKSSAKTVTLIETGSSNYKNVAEAGGLSSILSKLMGKFMKVEQPNSAVDKNALPPANQQCKIDPAKVQSATCEEQGANYIVTIVTAPEVNPAIGNGGAGSIIDVITEQQILDPVKGIVDINNIQLSYENVKVVATIDKATGNMTALTADGPCVLSLNAKAGPIKIDGAKVGIEVINKYTIAF